MGCKHSVRADCEEIRSQGRAAEVALRQEVASVRQSLSGELASAMRNEAAAVATLDEQLWLTDQRLGQRIDELAHLHLRDRVSSVEQRCKEATTFLAVNPGGGLLTPSSEPIAMDTPAAPAN